MNMQQKADFRAYVLRFEDKIEDFLDFVDGLIIPGGRDIDPELYGEQNTFSVFDKVDSKLRWDHITNCLSNVPKKLPIMGICAGY